jgi:hypothetical protein
MSDQNLKKDSGKMRYDLFPNEVQTTENPWPLEAVYAALKFWWTGKPYGFPMTVPRREIPGIVRVLGFGAAKYEPRGWEKGIPFSRIYAAACRHAESYLAGDYVDEESGQAHQSHFWCNVVFLLAFLTRGRSDLDDRPEPSPETVAQLQALEQEVLRTVGLPADTTSLLTPSATPNRKSN